MFDHKKFLSYATLLLVLVFMMNVAMPAWAEGDNSASSASSTKGTSSTTGVKSLIVHLPQSLASIVVGAAVGMPVALFRCTHRDFVRAINDASTIGGVPKPLGNITAALFGIPSGFLSSGWDTVINGMGDSIANADKPFSKDCFSLGKMLFNNP